MAETIREVMTHYDRLRAEWIKSFGNETGFDKWFTNKMFSLGLTKDLAKKTKTLMCECDNIVLVEAADGETVHVECPECHKKLTGIANVGYIKLLTVQ